MILARSGQDPLNGPFVSAPNVIGLALKTLTSTNKESRPVFLGDNRIWSFPSDSSPSDYSIWRS